MVGKKAAIIGTVASILFASVTAAAQNAPPPTAPPPPPAGGTDHDGVVGHIGVTVFGVDGVPYAGAMAGAPQIAAAPVVGVRYWLMRNIGIDAGLGFGWGTGSTTTNPGGMSVDNPNPFAFVLHGGLPYMLADSQHFTFLVIPELNFGYATETLKNGMGMPDTTLSGVLFNLGGRVGAEIHFGVIGLPQLALQGSVGLLFQYSGTKSDTAGVGFSTSATSLATTVNAAPWAIFTNAIAATYYL
jgi:hypothetical protein